MNDLPRQKLCELIRSYGTVLCDEPLRFEGLMRDFCPGHRRDVNVLVMALKERVAADLLNSSTATPIEMLLGRLTKRMEDQHATTPEMSRWAVESWALALGKIAKTDLTKKREPSVSKPVVGVPSHEGIRQPMYEAPTTSVAPIPPKQRSVRWLAVISAIFLCVTAGAAYYFAEGRRERHTTAPPPLVTLAPPPPQPTPVPTLPPATPIPATPMPLVTSLDVTVQPAGAQVALDDTPPQLAPAHFDTIAPGHHRIAATLGGFNSVQLEVDIAAGQALTIGPVVLTPIATPAPTRQVVAHPKPKRPELIIPARTKQAPTSSSPPEDLDAKFKKAAEELERPR